MFAGLLETRLGLIGLAFSLERFVPAILPALSLSFPAAFSAAL
jgi:hypothetical protein